MSNYSALKTAIQQAVYTNGNNEITGAGLQAVLLQIVNTVGDGYVFAGVATAGTSPGTPDANVFYIAPAGTYTNFGSSYTVPTGSIGVFTYNGSWTKMQISTSGIPNIWGFMETLGKVDVEPSWGGYGYFLLKAAGNITTINSDNSWQYSEPILLRKGEKIAIGTQGSGVSFIVSTDSSASEYRTLISASMLVGYNWHYFTATYDRYVAICAKTSNGDVKVCKMTDYTHMAEEYENFKPKCNTYALGTNNNTINIDFNSVSSITIKSSGFSVIRKGIESFEHIGFVGYVAESDNFQSYILKGSSNRYTLYFINTSALSKNSRTAFSQGIVKVELDSLNSYTIPDGYILLCAFMFAYIIDYGLLSSWLSSWLQLHILGDEGVIISGNNSRLENNISALENGFLIGQNGVSVLGERTLTLLGYIGYVSGQDLDDKLFIVGDSSYKRTSYYIDLSALSGRSRTAFSQGIVKMQTNTDEPLNVPYSYVKLASFYYSYMDDAGLFGVLFEKAGEADSFSSLKNMADVPFFAFSRGRINNANGEGVSWYSRFNIFHISDTHQYNMLLAQSVSLASRRVSVVINTGDDANGIVTTSAADEVSMLTKSAYAVEGANIANIPYIVTIGNHDVTNITKKQYYDIMCKIVSDTNPSVVWGNASGYRCYCYVDYYVNAAIGTIRVIVLDPCDYNDGQFPDTRAFQSVVFSQAQINWFVNALKGAIENNYHVMTVMHYSFGDASTFNEEYSKPDALYYQDPFMIPDIIDAAQNGASISKTYTDSKGLENVNVNTEFTGELSYICHLFGHVHAKSTFWCSKSDGTKDYDILMIGEAALGQDGVSLNKVSRIPGTIDSMMFSGIAIDTVEQNLYRTAYGACIRYDAGDLTNYRFEKIGYRRS